MTWTDIFKTVAAVLASVASGGAVIFACSSWLGKVWARRILEKERAALEKLRLEHEVRFSKLHEKRVELIEQLYDLLVAMSFSFGSLMAPYRAAGALSLEKQYEEFVKQYNELNKKFQSKRIYFDDSFCKIMDELTAILFKSHLDLSIFSMNYDVFHFHTIDPALAKERREEWEKIRGRFENDVTKLKAELESSFRKLLGVTS